MLITAGAVAPDAVAVVADEDPPVVVADVDDFLEEEQAKAVRATITPRAETARMRVMGNMGSLMRFDAVNGECSMESAQWRVLNGEWRRRWCRWTGR
jgi:hypothetical protein